MGSSTVILVLAAGYDKADLGKHLGVPEVCAERCSLRSGCWMQNMPTALTYHDRGSSSPGQMPRARLTRGDIRDLPFGDETFGCAWSIASVVRLAPADLRSALAESARVLVPQGVVFMSVAHRTGSEWRTAPMGLRWFHYYAQSDVEDATQRAGLEVVKVNGLMAVKPA